jgi:hypothetical protein
VTFLALQVSSAAINTLIAVTKAQRAHPELEVPPSMGHRLAGIAIRSVNSNLPVSPIVLPKKPRNGFSGHRAKILGRPKLPSSIRLKDERNYNLTEPPWEPEPIWAAKEASSCRALLLEIVRRSAYDWVLYRLSSDMANKKLADDAFHWLFLETRQTAAWRERERCGKQLTAFLDICELLDLDPDVCRQQIRKLTVKNVTSIGRPAEKRHQSSDEPTWSEHQLHLAFETIVSVGAL